LGFGFLSVSAIHSWEEQLFALEAARRYIVAK